MSQAFVSIIIPTKNAGAEFAELLRRVFAQRVEFPFEVIVIDSGSSDGTVEIARQFQTQIVRIRPEEFNHGATRDRAISVTRGEFVVLLVQDALPYDEQWLAKLIAPMLKDEQIAGTYSRHVARPGSDAFVHYYGMDHPAARAESRRQQLDGSFDLRQLTFEKKFDLFCFSNVASAVRRSVWERFPFGSVAFGEDFCWAKRVMEAGYAIYYQPESVVIHSHDRSAWYDFKRVVAGYRLYSNLFPGQPQAGRVPLVKVLKVFPAIYHNLFQLQHERYNLSVIWKGVTKAVAYPLGRFVGRAVHNGAHPWLKRLGDWITRGV